MQREENKQKGDFVSAHPQPVLYSVKLTGRQLQVAVAIARLESGERRRGFLGAIARQTMLSPSTIDNALRSLRNSGVVVDSSNGPKIAAETVSWAGSPTYPICNGFSGAFVLDQTEIDPSDLTLNSAGIQQEKSGTCDNPLTSLAPNGVVPQARVYEVQVNSRLRVELLNEAPEVPIVRNRWGRRLRGRELAKYIQKIAVAEGVEPEQVDFRTMLPSPVRLGSRRQGTANTVSGQSTRRSNFDPETADLAFRMIKGIGKKLKGADPRNPKTAGRTQRRAVERDLLDDIVNAYAEERRKLDVRYVPRGQGPWSQAAKLVKALRSAGVPQACWRDYIRWAFAFAPSKTQLAFVPWNMLSGMWLIENFDARRTNHIRWDAEKVRKLLRSSGLNARLGLRYTMVARVLLFDEPCSNTWSADDLAGAQCLIDNLDLVLGVNAEAMIVAQGKE